MNKVERPPTPDSPTETPPLPAETEAHKAAPVAKKSRAGRRILGIGVLLLLAAALGIGV